MQSVISQPRFRGNLKMEVIYSSGMVVDLHNLVFQKREFFIYSA
jgi:hypothetical protein